MAGSIELPLFLLHRKVGPSAILSEALFFSELSRLANRKASSTRGLIKLLEDLIVEADPSSQMQRWRTRDVRLVAFHVNVEPPRPTEAWAEPLTLQFHALIWNHEASHQIARIVELGIEVVASPRDELEPLLVAESLAFLRRNGLIADLRALHQLQRSSAVELESHKLATKILTLKQRAVKAEKVEQAREQSKKTVLEIAATLWKRADLDPAFEVDETLDALQDALTGKPPQSVLLVGPGGVGKTATVREFVRQADRRLLGETPFYATSGSRIVAGQSGFGMWESRCQELIHEVTKRRAILHIGNLIELLDTGKSEHNPTGVAAFLRPAIARGQLLCIGECTPEQIDIIEREDPLLLQVFRRIDVEEPNRKKGAAILWRFAEQRSRRPLRNDALDMLDRLHRRYATYSAYPGRPLRFLDALIRDGAKGKSINASEVQAGFARETGLPNVILDPDEPMPIEATRGWFASRVVGQPEAVDTVTNHLFKVKAGTTRPNRPIASMLFIGPTGVGKTEMAKALAEFLFGSRERLTRFDMSEYADPVAVRRLVGGASGREGLLTAKVREQPFCVLLLDEIEKAHSSVFDLLLQALGEARLTDAAGRLADFRNCVVILTSNLGAAGFQMGTTGFQASAADPKADPNRAKEHFTAAVEKALRPEMFNRLDHVVAFQPLDREMVRRITDREWTKITLRNGLEYREAEVAMQPELLDHLAAVGYDPRYGARPLKRAMERELLAPLASRLNRYGADMPVTVNLSVAETGPVVKVQPVQGRASRRVGEPSGPSGRFAVEVQMGRRRHQLLAVSSSVREFENEIFRLTRAEEKILKKQRAGTQLQRGETEILARLGRLRDVHQILLDHRNRVTELEDDAMILFYDGEREESPEFRTRLGGLQKSWDELLFLLYELSEVESSLIFAIFGESRSWVLTLAQTYGLLARRRKVKVESHALIPAVARPDMKEVGSTLSEMFNESSQDRIWLKNVLMVRDVKKVHQPQWVREWFNLADGDSPADAVGLVLTLEGRGADLYFGAEAGVHEYRPALESEPTDRVVIHVESGAMRDFFPPEEALRRGYGKDESRRRIFDFAKGICEDRFLDEQLTVYSSDPVTWLDPLIQRSTEKRLLSLILE